jgi:branched-chain amino acid transport system permease protein
MFAGLAFVFTANLVSVYLPLSWAPIPIIAFGLGAILVAKDPEGTVATVNRQISHVGHLLGDLISGRRTNAAFPTATTESGG